jgi:hypothetical protein
VYRNHQKARRESSSVADIDFDGMSDGIADDKNENENENAE